MCYNFGMNVTWKDFCKLAAPKPIVNGVPRPGAAPRPIANGKTRMANPAPAYAVSAAPKPSPGRVGGSGGAVSTEWVQDQKQEAPKWGIAHKCDYCGQVYGRENPAWSAGDKRSYAKNLGIEWARHQRMCDLKRKYKGRKIPIEEIRRAFNGR